jgi:hypothetical protein
MDKHQRDLERIREIKESLKTRTTKKLIEWKRLGFLGNPYLKAIEALLKERGIAE